MSLDWMVWQGLFEEEPSEWKSDLIGRREACRDWGVGGEQSRQRETGPRERGLV